MIALTLAFVCALYALGLRSDRAGTVTEAGVSAHHVAEHLAPASVTAPGLYRGHTAYYWARKFRHRTWQYQRARAAVKAAISAPRFTSSIEAAFMCIHSGEGSWTDSGAPFWGGLQMDMGFQRHYGSWALKAFGTADNWPVSVQLAVAIQAKVSGRGFYPWPNTARNCGLI